MAVLDNVIEILRRWDGWRRIEALPSRVDELERRVAELESRLRRAPGEACPSCGEFDFRVTGSRPVAGAFAELGVRERTLKCGACGFEDVLRACLSAVWLPDPI
jgi:hypothetical protein